MTNKETILADELHIAKKIIKDMDSCNPAQRMELIEQYSAFFRAVTARVQLEKLSSQDACSFQTSH